MQVRELENSATCDEKSKEIKEQESLKENSRENDMISASVVDISGKVLDFPLLEGVRSTVEGLYVYKNGMNLIPRAVGRLKGLKTLKFFANEVNFFPGEFKNLVELEQLHVKLAVPGVNGLELSKLKNLKELELSRGPPRPSAFPILSEIAGVKGLTKLSVCHFSIRYLPPEISCLNKLEFLDLSFNKMRTLPDEIASLSSLISLKVANNKLVELPPGLSSLHRLEDLDLSNNQLTSLGFLELGSMHNLHCLNLQHNNLRSCCQIPSWICCNLEGNSNYISNDESAEMDVYQGVVENGNSASNDSSITPCIHSSCPSLNNRSRAARRTKGRKWRCNLPPRSRQERLNYSKKWKLEAAAQSTPEKCMACRMSDLGDNSQAEGSSALADDNVGNKESFPGGDVYENSLIDIENVDVDAKDSVITCSCSELDTAGIHKEVEDDSAKSGATLNSVSDAAKVLDDASSSEASNNMTKSKRLSEKDLENPKPTKSRKPTNEPIHLSCQYSKTSFCGVDDHLPDGFYDAGRERPFMPLSSYEQKLHLHSREVILVDRERDEDLDSVLLCARALVYHFKKMNGSTDQRSNVAIDNLQIASLLALFVSDHFGGSDKSVSLQRIRKAVSGSNYRKPFVCTCSTGTDDNSNMATKQGVNNAEDIVFMDLCEKSLQSLKARLNSIIVPIGGLQFGVCRHRAVLMKYLCDRMVPRIPCELVRGYLDFSPHAWNVIVVKRGNSRLRMIVDACHPHDIREETDPEYFCRYVPLSRISSPIVTDGATSPNHSFPSLSVCDEMGKLASTTLMRCNFGSLDAAVKVRTTEVHETSADEIRNFEYSCLGEIRMLSVLKHPCIVEFYGHQISSTWSITEDGNYARRSLQSAILMEYMKGGSLKSYLEKLAREGKKHVDAELSLFIARDVAFALTELHSKDIIHRDVKSENVLVDLDKRIDGTPIVKICDFDRAIPLRSCFHSCCIAHIGIPPPDTCVGTPRWMAPEVFRAMHRRNMYGLEVDIWSFGCLLLELLTLQVPYSGLSESEIHNLLQMGERPQLTEELEVLAQSDKELETDSEILKLLVKLYKQCTEQDPSDRPTADNLYNMLLARASSISVSRSSKQE